MNRPTDVGWVKPAIPIRGLDHLGVQAPCIALYTQLLPGITNVTDRARYYSFYPWLIRSFEQRYRDHSGGEFRRVLRRAECLFALIAIRHLRVIGDGDDSSHGAGMVGRFNLLRIRADEKAIELADYADLDGPKRYFKNPLGGLGQYYFSPLRDLRVLDYTSERETGLPGYDKQRGSSLAEAFGVGMPEDDFFELLEKRRIRWADLDTLAEFCPCSLRKHKAERTLLLDLFLARSDSYRSAESENRRASLTLILELVGRNSKLEGYNLENLFLASAYTTTLANGSSWDVPPSLRRLQRGWAIYEKNELLSLALQGLFAAVLGVIDRDRSGRLENAVAAGNICAGLLPSSTPFRRHRIADMVAEMKSSLPSMSAWQNDAHELQRGWKILELGIDDSALKPLVEESVYLLLSLLARGLDDSPYAEFDFEPDYFDAREIHLLSFKHTWQSIWPEMTIEEWVRWLTIHWGIQRHLNVALRKLRGEHRDTFRIRPLEQELRVIEVPPPAATVPRLGKAFQILRDLSLTDLDADGWPTLTNSGRSELEACLGS